MRVAVVSDIHSNLEALTEVLRSIGTADLYLCLGDLVGYGANPNEVLEQVKGLEMRTIMGNHDYAAVTGNTENFNAYAAEAIAWTQSTLKVENASYLSRLPKQVDLRLGESHLNLVHGSPAEPLEEYIYPDEPRERLEYFLKTTKSDLLLVGHTHVPMNLSLPSGRIVNPGSVGQPRDGDPRASYAIIEINEGRTVPEILRVEYDVDLAARKIREAGLPSFLADRLYDGL